VGTKVTNPEPGDVVVYWRESINSWKGHVGIFMGFSKDGSLVYTLGGNQGNAVSISAYKADEVLGFRRLTNASKIVKLPEPTLKKGSTGNEVILLQDILKMLGYEVGTSDGDFGAKTENGLKLLQSTNKNIAVSVVYDQAAKEYINELLKS
jgi:peptidoglycan hydrolase-like protein with peptidoglycan-binding domain